MPGETVKLQVELVEKNAEARLKALDKLAKEMGNRKITLNFDEASLARWKAATDNMSAAQISAYAKLAAAAENANAKMVAAGQKSVQVEMQQNAKLVTERQKSIDKKIQLWEKEDTKRRQISEKTVQTEINANAKIEAAAQRGANAARNQTNAQKGLNEEAKKTDGIFSSLTSRFTAANLISSAVTRGITLLRTALRQAIDEMKEMDKELTTIKMVTGASDMDISALRQQAFAGARDTGRTTSDYLSAAERFARAGYRENIQDLTKLSLVTQNVGGVTEDVASKFILAADAAWKMGGNTERLWSMLDGVTSIADQNATDIGKIAEAYTVAGSAFANAGESERTFAALIGTTTAATQRSGSEMARGLQTILFRVRQVKGELDDGEIINASDISNAAKALDSVGISVLNDAKELKSFTEIMGELNEKWDTLNTKEKAYLQNALAGNRRGNVLFSLMDNYDVYQRQLEQFDEASGTALQKNEVYLDSWQAKSNELKTAWTDVVSTLTMAGGPLQNIITYTTNALNKLNDFLKKQNEINQNYDRYAAAKAITGSDRSEVGWLDAWFDWMRPRGKKSWNRQETGGDISSVLNNFVEKQKELANASIEVIKVYEGEAEAVDALSEAFSKANASIKDAAESMKDEKDSSIKSAADIYKAMQEAAEKGYYGSNAYKAGAQLFFGTSDKDAIGKIAQESLDTYFGAIAQGDYSNAAAALWGNFANASGEIVDEATGQVIASMTDLGDAYQWAFNKGNQSIDEFLQSMQDSTGIGADFWASMIRSLGMYSDEMDDWMAENTEMPEPELKVKTDSAQSEVQTAVDNINSMLDGIQDKTVRVTIIQEIEGMSVENAQSYAYAKSKGASMTAYYKSRGYAGGKRDSYSGPALVNDEFPANGSKPELIISKSQGRAYIANGGRPALVNLRSDDVVLTASETKSALGIPGFAVGKGLRGIDTHTVYLVGPDGEVATNNAIITTSPKNTTGTSGSGGGGGGGSSAATTVDPNENWGTLKKLVDYLLDKGNDDLKDQLKVLDDQLAELEAERKAQEESNKLQERQEAVQQALLDLNKAQVERTVRYYNEETQQWEWMADQKAVQDAQEAYDKALQDLNDYLADQDYEERKAAIQAQKEDLQAQFDAYKESWEAIVDAIEAPSGDLKVLLEALRKNGTSTMIAQSGGIAALLNALSAGLVASGYQFGLSNINANTSGSTTGTNTVFDSGGIALGSGFMRKGAVGPEAVIGPGITSAILNPVRNANFTNFADSVWKLLGASNAAAVAGKSSYITNNSGGNIVVNGMKIGEDMMQKPFAEVMRTISLHVNEAV